MVIDSKKVLYSPGNNDECMTPEYGVTPLLDFLSRFIGKTIWCPFDTEDSNFVKWFKKCGFKIEYSHISTGQDYYHYEPKHWDLMISNPPFTGKREIFERAISFNKPFALLMTNTWLNDKAPYDLFKDIGLQLLMFDKRIEYEGLPGEKQKKITFKSSYYCRNFLPEPIVWRELQK
jgi:hypothetical protein